MQKECQVDAKPRLPGVKKLRQTPHSHNFFFAFVALITEIYFGIIENKFQRKEGKMKGHITVHKLNGFNHHGQCQWRTFDIKAGVTRCKNRAHYTVYYETADRTEKFYSCGQHTHTFNKLLTVIDNMQPDCD
jgi:hypothetical protein